MLPTIPPDPVTRAHIALLARTEAIFLDPCYTGKVFHGFVDMVKSGIIPRGERHLPAHWRNPRPCGPKSIWTPSRRSFGVRAVPTPFNPLVL